MAVPECGNHFAVEVMAMAPCWRYRQIDEEGVVVEEAIRVLLQVDTGMVLEMDFGYECPTAVDTETAMGPYRTRDIGKTVLARVPGSVVGMKVLVRQLDLGYSGAVEKMGQEKLLVSTAGSSLVEVPASTLGTDFGAGVAEQERPLFDGCNFV